MKKILITGAALMLSFGAFAQELLQKYTSGLQFCESVIPYKNMMLVGSFGTSELLPLNREGKGYISAIMHDGEIKTLIPADGNLSAPKGLAILEHHLFVADVNKIVVYNLRDLAQKPQTIQFPEEDTFVNDIVMVGRIAVVSVTNTNRLYGINMNINDINNLSDVKPKHLADVPGPNGLTVYDTNMYIGSYDPNGNPTAKNVIYVADIISDEARFVKLIPDLAPGQYDGVAVSNDGSTLYFSSWAGGKDGKGAVYSYSLVDKNAEVKTLSIGETFVGPADIVINRNNQLWIPDLATSTVYKVQLKK